MVRSGQPSRTSWWLVAAGLLLGVAGQLTVETPAGLMRAATAAASRGRLTLDSPEGGLWSGAGDLAWQRPPLAPVALGRWGWSARLVRGLPGWRLQAISGPVQGGLALRLGPGAPGLDDVDLRMSAQALPTGLGSLDFLHASGELALQSERLSLRDGVPAGRGQLAWRHAGTPLVALAPLGSWRADWTLRDQGADYVLATEAGPLHVEGRGRLGAEGHLSLQGRAWSEPAAAAALLPVLQMLGSPAPDGSVTVSLP